MKCFLIRCCTWFEDLPIKNLLNTDITIFRMLYFFIIQLIKYLRGEP